MEKIYFIAVLWLLDEKVYQFKITLKDINPPVWRRIQVPENYSFWDLHVAIQDSMGWFDCHLHRFEIKHSDTEKEEEMGIPDDEMDFDIETLPGWEKKIFKYFTLKNNSAFYIYDFGDDWEHSLGLEKIVPRDKDITYPICIDGKRACPPEDCGGTGGYENFLRIISDPNCEEYEEMMEWIGGKFDPEDFDVKEISFDAPKERLKFMLEN